MSIPVFEPRRDADLLNWSRSFDAKINAAPAQYGLSPAQATAYAALHAQWVAAFMAVQSPGTCTKTAYTVKKMAREALVNGPGGAWELVRYIQALPTTTNDMRVALGLRIRDTELTPIHVPKTRPELWVVSIFNRRVRLRLKDMEHSDRRGKPKEARGAVVLMHVGAEAPADPSQWMFARLATRPEFDVSIPHTVEPGSKVWVTAAWYSARGQLSAAAVPVSVYVGEGLAKAG